MTAVAVVRPRAHDPGARRRPVPYGPVAVPFVGPAVGAPPAPRPPVAGERSAPGHRGPAAGYHDRAAGHRGPAAGHHGRAAGRPVVLARRRVVALVALLAACLALRWAVGGLGGAPLAASEPISSDAGSAPAVVVVQPGDTLWGLARALQPEGDVRPLVDRLSAERGGRPLQVGERVRAP